jgi:drug/metabolite transporter (DMT)-like permease
MKILLPIFYATIAAMGNAFFTLGQKKSANVENELLFISVCVFITFLIAICIAPLTGEFHLIDTAKGNWKAACLSGVGLFFPFLGFNLLYSKYGASQYVLYAVISIITTTLIVGVLWLKETINVYHMIAIVLAIIAVFMFSFGQSKI